MAAPLGVELESLTDAQCVGWAQDLECLGRFLSALQVQAAGDLAARVREGRFEDTGASSPVELLTATLRVGRAEANRRLRLADHFLPHTNPLTLVTTGPSQPLLGSAFFTGTLSTELALLISSSTDDATHLAEAGRIPTHDAHRLEATLTGHGQEEGPDFLRRVASCALDLLDPDGQQPTEGELTAKQGIFFRLPRRGLIHYDGHLTIAQYESLMAAIGWATNPSPHKDITTTNNPGTSTSNRNPDTSTTTPPGQTGLTGQTGLLDVLHTLTKTTPTQAPATTWPPPQGPVPDWAQPTTTDNTGTNNTTGTNNNGGGTGTNNNGGGTGTNNNGGGTGTNNNGGGTGAGARDWGAGLFPESEPETGQGPGQGLEGSGVPAPWPHVVEGISVPAPGSTQELPGLDPIDPACTDPAVADKRTHGQKLLDGLIDCLKLAARTGLLPVNGGMKPQLIISTTEAALQRSRARGKGGGIAFLPYTGPHALSLFETEMCDADVTTMILGDGQNILNVGRTQRLFTEAQRKILIARDLGCTFPACTRPASWCQAHHLIPWQDGGETNINNGCLLCTLHHHLIHKGYWSVRLLNGTPFYTPTYNIDPLQRERRNTYHHGLPNNP